MSTGTGVILAGRRVHLLILHFPIFPVQPTFLASRSDILACRQAHLLFFTILSVQPAFWHRGGIILACRRGHFGMSTGTFTILGFTIPPCPPIVWHRRASFWHVDGHTYYFTLYYSPCPTNILASRGLVDGHMCYFALYYSSLPAYFLASRGVILACRRGDFGMSTGTFTISYYTLYYIPLSNQLVGIAGRHFGMSTGSFWHVDGHIYYFTLCSSPWPTNFLASQGIILACRRAHLLFYILLFPFPTYFFCIAGRHFGMSTGTFITLFFTIPLSNVPFGIPGRRFWDTFLP